MQPRKRGGEEEVSPDVEGALKYLQDAYPCLGEKCMSPLCPCVDWEQPYPPDGEDVLLYYKDCKGWNLHAYLVKR